MFVLHEKRKNRCHNEKFKESSVNHWSISNLESNPETVYRIKKKLTLNNKIRQNSYLNNQDLSSCISNTYFRLIVSNGSQITVRRWNADFLKVCGVKYNIIICVKERWT